MKRFLFAASVMFLSSICLQAQDVKIAFIGNSITEGYTVAGPEINAYPGQLLTYLGEGYEIMNSGVSGCTLLRNGNKPIWDESVFADALAFEPDIIFILLGTNDSKPLNWDVYQDEFYGDYVTMVDTFSTGDNPPEIWACLPPPAFSIQWDIRDSVIVNGIIPVIEQVIEDKGLNRLDFRTPFLDKNELFPDDIHPNLTGHREMAKILFETLLGYPVVERFDRDVLAGSVVVASDGSNAEVLLDSLWYSVFTPAGTPVSCTFSLNDPVEVDAFAIIPESLDDVLQYTIEGDDNNAGWTMLVDQSGNADPPAAAYTDTIQPVNVTGIRLNLFQSSGVSRFIALEKKTGFHGPVMTVELNREAKSSTYYNIHFTPVTNQGEVFSLYRDRGNGMGFSAVFGYKTFDYTDYLAVVPLDETHQFYMISYLDGAETTSTQFLSLFRIDTGVEKELHGTLPAQWRVSANYPNPFNPRTRIMYSASETGPVSFQVINLRGQMVYRADQFANAGETIELVWDGRDITGREMPGGVYVFKIRHPNGMQTQKAMLMR